MSDQPRRNLELKAYSLNPEQAVKAAVQLGARAEWTRRQTDTYFRVAHGRLKLREQDGCPAELIAYKRTDDVVDVRVSDYRIVPVVDAESIKAALTQTLGIEIVVSKRRTLYLWQNVRIHVDEVDGLEASFIEFEAVISNEHPEDVSAERVARLCLAMHIERKRVIQGSYADLLKKITER
jgi:predicted adenylyl cyclase CyaB